MCKCPNLVAFRTESCSSYYEELEGTPQLLEDFSRVRFDSVGKGGRLAVFHRLAPGAGRKLKVLAISLHESSSAQSGGLVAEFAA